MARRKKEVMVILKILLNRNLDMQINWHIDQYETSQSENQNKYLPALHAWTN